MSALPEPTGVYRQPPDGQLVTCPHCNKILNHHRVAVAPVSTGSNSKAIELFGNGKPDKAPETPTVVASEIVSGDIFVPEPSNVVAFEHVKTGQARPERQQHHHIPGTPKKVVAAAPPPPPPVLHPTASGLEVLDHPVLGGKITICVCLFGEEHHALHRRCLNSICQTVQMRASSNC